MVIKTCVPARQGGIKVITTIVRMSTRLARAVGAILNFTKTKHPPATNTITLEPILLHPPPPPHLTPTPNTHTHIVNLPPPVVSPGLLQLGRHELLVGALHHLHPVNSAQRRRKTRRSQHKRRHHRPRGYPRRTTHGLFCYLENKSFVFFPLSPISPRRSLGVCVGQVRRDTCAESMYARYAKKKRNRRQQ